MYTNFSAGVVASFPAPQGFHRGCQEEPNDADDSHPADNKFRLKLGPTNLDHVSETRLGAYQLRRDNDHPRYAEANSES
jgi:hypothetical protein